MIPEAGSSGYVSGFERAAISVMAIVLCAGCRSFRAEVAVPQGEHPQDVTWKAPAQDPVGSTTYPDAARPAVLDQLKFYGDMRLRQESNFELGDDPDRHRQVLRIRLGVNYQLNDETLIGARIVTGNPDNPNTSHVTLGSGFEGLDVNLDRVFLSYRPDFVEGAFLTAGKFDHPFARNPTYGELLWDADLQPEGLVLGRTFGSIGPIESWKLTLGGYALLTQSAADDAFLWVSELVGNTRLAETVTSNLAVSYYGYSEVTPDGSTVLLGKNRGNAVRDSNGDGDVDEFVSDFGIVNAVAGVTHAAPMWPLTVSAEYIKNLHAEIDGDTGWAAGFSLGQAAKRGDWRLYYQWQVIEQDAVFSAFAQDDFLFATNHRSHALGANYQFTDQIGLLVWLLVSQPDDSSAVSPALSEEERWRVRVELNVKF